MTVATGIYLAMAVTAAYAIAVAVLAIQSERREWQRCRHAGCRTHRLHRGG